MFCLVNYPHFIARTEPSKGNYGLILYTDKGVGHRGFLKIGVLATVRPLKVKLRALKSDMRLIYVRTQWFQLLTFYYDMLLQELQEIELYFQRLQFCNLPECSLVISVCDTVVSYQVYT